MKPLPSTLAKFYPPTLALFYPKIPLLLSCFTPPITPYSLSSFYPTPPPPLLTHLLLHRFNPLPPYSCIIVRANLPPTLTPFYPPPPPNYPHYPPSCIELPNITLQNDVRVLRGVGYKFPEYPLILHLFGVKIQHGQLMVPN